MTNPKIFIIIHTLYHHVYKLAENVKAGLIEAGCDAEIYQVEETLSEEILVKMHVPVKPKVPVIKAADALKADGLLFGVGTRYGMMSAQMKAFWDSTGQIWSSGGFVGKMAGIFFSTAVQSGGQETTALTFVTQFAHHGMIYVPIGYSCPVLFDTSEVIGGSPYGAGTVAGGDGSRQPSAKELTVAKHQGSHFGKIVKQYIAGKK